MDRKEFEQKKSKLQYQIGQWKIVLDQESFADFVLGCFWDKTKKCWKVYINNERGRHRIRLETSEEDMALMELMSMIEFEVENNRNGCN